MKNCKLILVFIVLLVMTKQLRAQSNPFGDDFPINKAQNINKPNIPSIAGLSVNSYSGNLFYQRTDLFIPFRRLPIDLTFYYNSSNTSLDLGYGPGWSMSYSMMCIPYSNSVTIRNMDGRKDVYVKNGNLLIPPIGIFDSLSEYQIGKYKLRTKTGMKYFFDDSTHHRLTSVVDANGNALTFTYTGSLPTMITDASGRSVTLAYTNGHLTQITDPNTSPLRTINYQYDVAGNPITVTDPMGYSMQYEYDVVHNMTKVIDQQSNAVTMSYLNCATVQTITSSLNSMHFKFNASQLTSTDSMMVSSQWQSRSYKYDTIGNIVEKTGNCCGYHELFEYDTMRNMIKMTDSKGYEWQYMYDAGGNRTQETNPMSGMTISNYDAVYNKEIFHKDPNNHITQYIYDAWGNKIQANKPLNVTDFFSYDTNGNMTTHVDGNGNISHFSYNAYGYDPTDSFPYTTIRTRTFDNVGNVLSITDPSGHVSTNMYDKLNRKIQTTNALGQVTLYAYNSRGNLISITDHVGHITTYQYDALGRRTHETTPAGTCSNTYDAYGNVITYVDNKGNTCHYTYDQRNRLISKINAVGSISTCAYDNNGNKIDDWDYKGNHTIYQYDSLNRLTKKIDPLGHITEYGYDANGNRISIKDANNHTTTFLYDALNRNTEIHHPIGIAKYEYDKNNNKTKIIDANNHTTNYAFDSLNRLKTMTDALSHSKQYVYDASNNLTAVTDRNGHTTLFQYDFLNRKIKTTNPLGEIDSTGYDVDGNVSVVRRTGGSLIWYSYDAAHRLIGLSDSLGIIESYKYDANSNVITVKNANNDSTRYTYDSLNRLKTTIDPAGNIATNSYDANSNLISFQDRNGHTTLYGYDADDRKTSSTSALGLVTTMGYDAVDNVITLTDGASHTSTYIYDTNDRLSSEWLADGTSKSYTYDAAGNMLTRTDNNGAITQYSYNVLDWLTLRNYPGSNDDVITYDNEGNVLTANNSNATISCTYDNNNRKLSETLNGKTVSYNYNVPGRKKSITYPGGRVIENNYDARMRLSSITELFGSLGANLASYNYDGANNLLTSTLINGVVSNYSYNDNDWVTNLSHKHLTDTIAAFNYTFDNTGNILTAEKRHRLSNSEKYTYDIDDRLTNYKEGILSAGNIASPLTQTQYNFDGVGNRTSTMKSISAPSTASNYIFTTSTGASSDPMMGATQILNSNNDNTPSSVMNIGFTFFYEGAAYNTFSMSPDGFIKLGSLATAEPTNNMASLTNRPKLMAMWDDLATGTNGSGKMLLTGLPGSRILKLQWLVTIPKNIAGASTSRIQIWLYEGTNVIEFRYGIGNNPTGGATVGINSATSGATIFQSVTTSSHTSSSSVPNNANNLWPGNQRMYKFTPGGTLSVSLSTNYSTDNVNKYTMINTTVPTYNANGNTLFDGTHTYQFDTENRLTGVNLSSLNASSYAHDAFGRRIQKTTFAGTIHYFYDGFNVIEERDNANTVLATYVNDPMDDNGHGTWCGVLSMQRGGINYFYHTNSVGSVVAVTNQNGTVAERYEYDEYGKSSIFDANYLVRNFSAIVNTYMYKGKEYDAETGNYYCGSRSYNPNWGRYSQRGYSSGINRYTYSMNNPANLNQSSNYINSTVTANGVSKSQMVNIYSYRWDNHQFPMENISMSLGNGSIHNMKNNYFASRLMEEEGMYYTLELVPAMWLLTNADMNEVGLYYRNYNQKPMESLALNFNISNIPNSDIQYEVNDDKRVPDILKGLGNTGEEKYKKIRPIVFDWRIAKANFIVQLHIWIARRGWGPPPLPPKPPPKPEGWTEKWPPPDSWK